jgi:hypothetical protein
MASLCSERESAFNPASLLMSRLCFVVGLVWLFRLQPLFIDCVAARLVLLTFIAIVVASRCCFLFLFCFLVLLPTGALIVRTL